LALVRELLARGGAQLVLAASGKRNYSEQKAKIRSCCGNALLPVTDLDLNGPRPLHNANSRRGGKQLPRSLWRSGRARCGAVLQALKRSVGGVFCRT